MPEWVEVSTQQELDAALRRSNVIPICGGEGAFVVDGEATVRAADSVIVRASGAATVEAGGSARVEASGSANVIAWDSAAVEAGDSVGVMVADDASVQASGSAAVTALRRAKVRARDSATVAAEHFTTVFAADSAAVMAWESATVEASGEATVLAWDRVRVEASERARVRAWGRATVTAADSAVVETWDPELLNAITTADQWCRAYGVEVEDGVAILYKAVGSDFRSRYGLSYEPGSEPQAADWDEGRSKCGGGLHFSPRPYMALEFTQRPSRFVACPVRIEDIVAGGGPHQNKVKAKGVCAPVYEVDENGQPVEERIR